MKIDQFIRKKEGARIKKKAFALALCLGMVFLALFFFNRVFADQVNTKTQKAGIVLSFDDNSVEDWYSLKDLFKEKGVHASFFVSESHKLSPKELYMLEGLEEDGHEIGSHSTNHLDPNGYIAKYSLEKYIEDEVLASKEDLEKKGFDISSFAFPFGGPSQELKDQLESIFLICRDTGYTNDNRTIEAYDSFYCKAGKKYKYTRACGLDNIYGNSDEDIFKGLKRARDKKEIIIFYSHKIDDEDPYGAPRNRIEKIIEKAQEYNLEFYCIRDLAG